MGIGEILAWMFLIYFLVDGGTYFVMREAALRYWNTEKPEILDIYTYLPLTNIPQAIYLWLTYGDPLVSWKAIET